MAPRILLINIAEYWTPTDSAIVAAGEGAQLERTNYPFTDRTEERWTEIDHLLAAGVYTEFVATISYTEWAGGPNHRPTFNAGMYGSPTERGQMAQLASYYMAVGADPQRLSFDQQNYWNIRPDTGWARAVEVDVGHPLRARHVIASGSDPKGQKYRIYAREFEHALVLIRPAVDWHPTVYGDDTAIEIPLSKPMRLLHSEWNARLGRAEREAEKRRCCNLRRVTAPSGIASARPRRAEHLPALDGLRAVAVFVVISYHAGVMQGVPGDLGVTLFFVLSGFLITWLLAKEFAATGSISIRSFYARRVLRIFPAYYVFILFSLAVDTALGHRWPRGLIAVGFTYLVNYYNAFLGHPTTSIAHAWSLAVEEQFYLLWPLACLALLRRSRHTAARGVAIVIVVTLLWRSTLYLFLHAPVSYLYNAFDTRCDSLAIGCFLALSLERQWFHVVRQWLQSSPLLPLVTLALIWLSHHFGTPAYHYTVGMTVNAALLAVFMVQKCSACPRGRSGPGSTIQLRAGLGASRTPAICIISGVCPWARDSCRTRHSF